ncbi:MAG TPA: 4a-hydroxytetrahydrobiopterin dehydratase [Verrucomicrobiales bacterium]|nr:4a-hydroxytetrahydrobiopterin dehydratase [Verrucomicrobiales bacterium]
MKQDKLSEEEVARLLGEVPGWTRKDEAITRTVEFPAFLDGIGFVSRVAEEAERMNHHPDIDIRWRRVRLVLSTHSAGGLTALDFDLARRINARCLGSGT